MSDPPITPRVPQGLAETTAPMAARPPLPGAAAPAADGTKARATQMSASVVPSTQESAHAREANVHGNANANANASANADANALGTGNPEEVARPFVSEEISGVLLTAGASQRDEAVREAARRDLGRRADSAHGGEHAPRRVAPATLASPMVLLPPADDGVHAALPPLPAVIDVGAPAHAFVAKSPHAPPHPPPLAYGAAGHAPAMHQPGGHGHAASQAHAAGQAHAGGHALRASRRSTSTSMMALVVVGVVLALLGVAAAVVTVGYVSARRAQPGAARPGRPGVTATATANATATATAGDTVGGAVGDTDVASASASGASTTPAPQAAPRSRGAPTSARPVRRP